MKVNMNHRNPAIKRILADVKELEKHPSKRYYASPLEQDMFEWHFTIRGPEDSPFAEGIYHGRIILPAEYPFKPPNIVFLTKNGRFEVGTKICLSISAYHEESWQPAWGVRTMLEAIISFFPSDGAGAIGALDWTEEERKKLAKESQTYCCPICGLVKDLLQDDIIEEEAEKEKIQQQISQLHMSKPKSESTRITNDLINGLALESELVMTSSMEPSLLIPETLHNASEMLELNIESSTELMDNVSSPLTPAQPPSCQTINSQIITSSPSQSTKELLSTEEENKNDLTKFPSDEDQLTSEIESNTIPAIPEEQTINIPLDIPAVIPDEIIHLDTSEPEQIPPLPPQIHNNNNHNNNHNNNNHINNIVVDEPHHRLHVNNRDSIEDALDFLILLTICAILAISSRIYFFVT